MKIKYNKIDLMLILLIFPFIIPDFLIRIPEINIMIKIWKVLVGGWTLFYMLQHKKINQPLFVLSIFHILIIVSALIHGHVQVDWITYLVLLWVIHYATETKEKRERFFNIIIWIYTIFSIINLITMIIFPNGMFETGMYEENWFLGYKNGIIRKLLPFIVILLISCNDRKMKIFEKIGLICAIISVILSQSLNNYIGIVVFILIYICIKKKIIKKPISLTKIFGIYAIFDILMIASNFLNNIRILTNSILDKNGSILGRVGIWNRSLELIESSPILGYGYIENAMYSFSFNISHPHNLLLYYLLLGGILCVIVFVIGLMIVDKQNKNSNKAVIINIILAAYVAFFAMGMLESLIGATFFIPFLILIYNINKEEETNDRDMHTI